MRTLMLCLLAAAALAAACKKEDDAPDAAPSCSNPDPINIDTGNAYFTLPTAFTPNGDGKNDFFSALSDRIDTGGFNLTVYENGSPVFIADNPYFVWMPKGYTGRRTSFSLQVKFRTLQGIQIDTCASLTIPRADSFGTCADDIAKLFFADQINIANGRFQYPTGEIECP